MKVRNYAFVVLCVSWFLVGHSTKANPYCQAQVLKCSNVENPYGECVAGDCDYACYYINVVIQANGTECLGIVGGHDDTSCEDEGNGCYGKYCYCSSDLER